MNSTTLLFFHLKGDKKAPRCPCEEERHRGMGVRARGPREAGRVFQAESRGEGLRGREGSRTSWQQWGDPGIRSRWQLQRDTAHEGTTGRHGAAGDSVQRLVLGKEGFTLQACGKQSRIPSRRTTFGRRCFAKTSPSTVQRAEPSSRQALPAWVEGPRLRAGGSLGLKGKGSGG